MGENSPTVLTYNEGIRLDPLIFFAAHQRKKLGFIEYSGKRIEADFGWRGQA